MPSLFSEYRQSYLRNSP